MRKEQEGLGSEDGGGSWAALTVLRRLGIRLGWVFILSQMLEKFVKSERVCVPITERGGRNVATRVIHSSFIC